MSDESVVKHLEQQTTLKLSQAMRIGAMIRPQCFGDTFSDGKSCAIGAAFEAATGRYSEGMPSYYAVERLQQSGVFSAADIDVLLDAEIMRRNDVLRHTREQIADWLEAKGY